jgi:hypothetical protein
MSKQPLAVVKKLRQQKTLVKLNDRDPRQLWLLIRQEPMDGNQGSFFVTHGRNFQKFEKRKGFSVIGHGYDKDALTAAARSATLACGPAYQPKFSAHKTAAKPSDDDSDDATGDGATKPPLII